jgi:hypothetical protein
MNVESLVKALDQMDRAVDDVRQATAIAAGRLHLAINRDDESELFIQGDLESFGELQLGPVLSWQQFRSSSVEGLVPALVIRTPAGALGRRIMGHIAYEGLRIVKERDHVSNVELLALLRPFLRLALTRSMLSPEEQTGLMGELQVLNEILNECPSALEQEAALAAWVGPLGARRDFFTASTAIEVKASPGLIHRVGYEQLLADPGEELFLASVRVRRDPSAQLKLPDHVQRVSDVFLADELRSLFWSRLAECGDGYHPQVADHYRLDYGFFLESAQLRRIDTECPSLRPASFVEGEPTPAVSGIHYSFDVAGIGSVGGAEKRAIFSRFSIPN